MNGASTIVTTRGLVDAFGRPMVQPDLGFRPPSDPLDKSLPTRPSVIYRDIPNVTTQTGYSPVTVRQAISDMIVGLFDAPSQLCESIMADSRVAATMMSRSGAIFGRPTKFRPPKGFEKDHDARKCCRVWERHYDDIFPESIASEWQSWLVMLGFVPAQMPWDMSGRWAIPKPRIWNPRFLYYHWTYRCYVAITQDGQVPIVPGDGHWILHSTHGGDEGYRAWLNAAMWSIAPWWLARNYALRDWARYSERHGLPMILALSPAAGDPAQMAQWRSSLASIGQESVIQMPQGVEPQYSYDMRLLEATDQGWMGFHQLIEQCNTEITLRVQGQNLTTEVKEGSYAAARVHADVKQAIVAADARSRQRMIRKQIARPFALMNFGRPEIAPVTEFDVTPDEDTETRVRSFQTFALALFELRRVGKEVTNVRELAASFGIDLGGANIVDKVPLQIEQAQVSGSSL